MSVTQFFLQVSFLSLSENNQPWVSYPSLQKARKGHSLQFVNGKIIQIFQTLLLTAYDNVWLNKSWIYF
jgi:hypothetical protein